MKTKRNQEYFRTLVGKIGEDIKSTSEVYELIGETDAEFGLSCPKNLLSVVMTKFCDILGDSISIVDDTDVRRRGRGVPKLYQINVDAALARIDSMPKHEEAAPKSIARQAKKPKEEKIFDHKQLCEDLYDKLERAYDLEDQTIYFKQSTMKRLMESRMDTVIFADWSAAKKDGVLVFRSRKDLKNSIISLDSLVKDKYEKDLGACAKFNIVKVTRRDAAVSKELTKLDQDYITYIIMKLILHEKHALDISVISKVLREHFGISMDRLTIIDLVKTVESLSISQDKQSIAFKDRNEVENAIRNYSPENNKEKIYARISMSLNEVLSYVPCANLVSKISESDGIYEIEIDRSFTSRARLLKLYRTFRGTDMILGSEDLVDYLNVQIAKADGLYKNDSFLYKLETM